MQLCIVARSCPSGRDFFEARNATRIHFAPRPVAAGPLPTVQRCGVRHTGPLRRQSDDSRDSTRQTIWVRPFCAHFWHRPSMVARLTSGRQAATVQTPASARDAHRRIRWARTIASARCPINLPPHGTRVPGFLQRVPRNDVQYNCALRHARAEPGGIFLGREMRTAVISRHVKSYAGSQAAVRRCVVRHTGPLRRQSDDSRDTTRQTIRVRPFCAHFWQRPSMVARLTSGRQPAAVRTLASACDANRRSR